MDDLMDEVVAKLLGKASIHDIFVDYGKMSSYPNTTKASIPYVNNQQLRPSGIISIYSNKNAWLKSHTEC